MVYRRFRGLVGPSAVVVVACLCLWSPLLLQTTPSAVVVNAFHAPSFFIAGRNRSFLGRLQQRSSGLPLYSSLTIDNNNNNNNKSEETEQDNDNNSQDMMEKMKKKQESGRQQHDITIQRFGPQHQHGSRHDEDDDDDDEREKRRDTLPKSETVTTTDQTTSRHRTRRKTTTTRIEKGDPRYDPLFAYMHGMKKRISDSSVLAYRLDDELKRMELRYFGLQGEDIPIIRYPLSSDGHAYNKGPRRPSLLVYELVAKAYATASLHDEGGRLAEDVLRRFQKHNPTEQPSLKLLGLVMRAWVAAGNFEKTEYWLRQIEEQFPDGDTDNNTYLPWYGIYEPLVVGLQTMRREKPKMAADLSMHAIKAMRANHAARDDGRLKFLLPFNTTYIAAMENIYHSDYSALTKFNKIDNLFRYQLEDYHKFRYLSTKPTKESAKLVFWAASRCNFPKDSIVAEKCDEVLKELQTLYTETGDAAFRPVTGMYECMVSIYARMDRRSNPQLFSDRTLSLLQNMKEMGVQFVKPFTAKAAINRVMQTAEHCMPLNLSKDPVKARDMFLICLKAFKTFHDEDDDGNTLVEPNASTYQIFLRACSRLPKGDSRSKLSAKAFSICKGKGLVSRGVCRELYAANQDLAVKEFGVPKENFDVGTLPLEWTENDNSHPTDALEIFEEGFHRMKKTEDE